MQLNLRKVLIGLIALAVIGWFLTGLNPQSLSQTQPEINQNGRVTLVIDFGSSSKLKPLIREVSEFSGTGWELFEAAGVAVSGTAEFPSGFVCRIEGVPTQDQQDCLDTPKYSEGSWAYFVTNSELGPGWILSGSGAATHRPECGSFEGWLWIAAGESSGQKMPSVPARAKPCGLSN